jgi:hypothetical protein
MTPLTIPLEAATEGDLVFFDSSGKVSWVIKLAQRIKWHGDKNHVAWLDHQDEHGQWFIGQAEGSGVTIDKPLVLGPNDVIVRPPASVGRGRMLQFLRAQASSKYGFLTDVSILITMLSPGFVNVMRGGTWICSAVVAEGLRFGGWLHNWPDIYQVAPDPLWEALS